MIMVFSSTNNIIVNPLLSSSSYHPLPPTVSSHETSNSYLHHYHCDPLLGPFLSTSPQITESLINMALTNNATMVEQNSTERLNGEHYAFSSLIPCKRVVKKDRHSKIHTAQGLRDRRVRLSIEIARRFFDLQDILGFDKASKTLEWLLNKSSKAIKELAQMKGSFHGGAKNLSGTSECEVASEDGDLECILSSSKPMVRTASGEKKMRRLHKAAIMHQAKESRAKARERARERTKEKMCTRKLRDWKKGSETNPGISNPSRSLNPSEAAEKSTDAYGHNITSSFRGVTDHDVEEPSSRPLSREDLIEESILIRRKLKTSSILGYQQNIVMSKDVSCSSSSHNNNNNYFLNLPQNWEINGAIAHSTFCAITNMNRSSGLQIYSKPCESHDNQCPL